MIKHFLTPVLSLCMAVCIVAFPTYATAQVTPDTLKAEPMPEPLPDDQPDPPTDVPTPPQPEKIKVEVEVADEEVSDTEEGESENDTTVIRMRRRQIIITTGDDGTNISIEDYDGDDDDDDEDWYDEDEWRPVMVDAVGLDIGTTNYLVDGNVGADAAIPDLEVRNFRFGGHVALHLFPTTISLFGKGTVNLKTAFTIDWSNYYYTNDITLRSEQDQVTIDTTGVLFRKNKLVARYVQIPLLLSFNTSPRTDRGVVISVGGFAGILWQGKTKQVSDEEGRVKVRDDFNLSRQRYGVTARFDFRWIDLYFNYHLNNLFEDGEGPETQMFTAGLNLLDF
ncbi:MAG: hypothetical protein AAGI38_24085 [Bacteroidota bacterium]